MTKLGEFTANTYRQWLNDYPDCAQADRWQEKLEGVEHDQQPGLLESAAPPMGNTGVQITNASQTALTDGLVLDWLACTIPVSDDYDLALVLRELRDRFPTQSMPYGGHGYTHSLAVFETGRIYWHPDHLGMGVHVSFTSQTLVSIAELLPEWDADRVLCYLVEELSAQPTRLDLALDTSADVVSKAELSLEGCNVTTRSRVFRVEKPKRFTKKGLKIAGYSVLVGSRQSETYVRLYDKALESGSDEPWYRLEFEFKGERAGAIAALLLTGDGDGIRGAMLAHLDFKQHSETDRNTTRWQTARWWTALLGVVVKRPLRLARVAVASIDKIGDWLDRQVGPNLALWWTYYERQEKDFYQWVMSYVSRWGPKHKRILATF